ncbi:NUDIX hydrolase N-terminal domain-containing protein [Lapidilactobacillus gannanensis]|uniref:NUDIX hydrolase N-terminal domain-containing protein n=1 Tax=Lapidilactobacillus gannanensis TaxID=2486002 RepID=A0ABW4BMZ3_9LACO|nr:NUDIX hydrolase N-terminal domain-containing protein [Lapidilactobacillus gannanensis]
MTSELLNSQRQMLALIQSGLHYTKEPFERDRYEKLEQILLEQMATTTNTKVADLTAALTQDQGYITPKVDVRALIVKNQQILMVQDKPTGEWSLPGGFADVGYTPTENIIREVFEETGLQVTVQGLLDIFDTAKRTDIPQPFQYYKMVFACQPVAGHFAENIETGQIAYFALDKLPALSLNRTTKEQLTTLMARKTAITVE